MYLLNIPLVVLKPTDYFNYIIVETRIKSTSQDLVVIPWWLVDILWQAKCIQQ